MGKETKQTTQSRLSDSGTPLKEGDKAPVFKAGDQNGTNVSLSDYRGQKLILYFYPKDHTPGCTQEACNFRDNLRQLQKKGYAIVGVSADSAASHQRFAAKYDLPFPLLADEQKTICKAYGVWGKKKLYGREYEGIFRTTFVIDEKGIIEQVIKKVQVKNAAAQITTAG